MGATQSAASGFSSGHSGCTPQVKGTGARGLTPAATPGLRSAPGPASPAKPPSSAGRHHFNVCRCVTNWTRQQARLQLAAPVTSREESSPGAARWRPSEHMPRPLGLTIR
jgi:hypothetical protein